MASITVSHRMEVAHRLWLTPGKCQNIHGHSMLVVVSLMGELDSTGKLEGFDFAIVKQALREHMDSTFDHHLILNKDDSLAQSVLPGLLTFSGDPTTENLAKHFAEWMHRWCGLQCRAVVHETEVNSAAYVTP